MKKTVPFDFFEDGQTLYFNISRLAELETAMGDSLFGIFTKQQDNTIRFYLNALRIGLEHHYPGKPIRFFAEKIDEYLDKGGKITDLIPPISEAVLASGIWGRPDDAPGGEKPEGKNEQSPLIQ